MITELFCNWSAILRDIPHQVWEAQTLDRDTSTILITRLLHNKVLFYGNGFSSCYVQYFSPDYLTQMLTIFGMLLFYVGLYYLVKKTRLILLAALLPLAPIIMVPRWANIMPKLILILYLPFILAGLWQIAITSKWLLIKKGGKNK